MERTPGRQALVGGVVKLVTEPVLVIIGERTGTHLSCDWVFTHAGLMPGDYPLVGGLTVRVPRALCAESHRAWRGVTLEVVSGY